MSTAKQLAKARERYKNRTERREPPLDMTEVLARAMALFHRIEEQKQKEEVKNIMKEIPGFKGYNIDEGGNVYRPSKTDLFNLLEPVKLRYDEQTDRLMVTLYRNGKGCARDVM